MFAKIYFSGIGTTHDINSLADNLENEYPEFVDWEETAYYEEPYDSITIDENDEIELLSFEVIWEGTWNGTENELGRLTHHAEGIIGQSEVTDVHCEVFYNEKWYGGNDHKNLD